MKKIIISSVAMALLVFSGCADKEPVVDEKVQEVVVAQEVETVKTEVVSAEDSSIDENAMSSSDSNEMNMANLERDLSTVYFDFDKFNIRADMQDKVTSSAAVAKDAASAFTIKLEGNCDEWGSDEYNFALGLKRASSVKKALISEGVSDSRITMVSYGESNPVCTDKTQECWSKNRRVDFKLLP
ncbi:MAG: peptidoglycan-associated lipoprotein Pal [Sulfurimonas sp.]|uniref:peptidoglycan-associated lipoprotein Pal n=1 Tax=Sulfurimonas sp. TaxID=2022749 RepID=UPI0025FCE944|nr:peptidoglycan-associated lipoprotein Pal [Sulfurimonas sp.]MCK9492409.1 peptidoglycan-associated lipoprotein Pal [Sulfurimonas sp.]